MSTTSLVSRFPLITAQTRRSSCRVVPPGFVSQIRSFSSVDPDDFVSEFESLFVDESIHNAAEDDAPKAPGSLGGPPVSPHHPMNSKSWLQNDGTSAFMEGLGGRGGMRDDVFDEDGVDRHQAGQGIESVDAALLSSSSSTFAPNRTTILNPACRDLWRAAKRNCRDSRLWDQLIADVKRQSIYLRKHDVLISFYALSKIRFRDTKFLRELGFQMVRHSASYSARELGLFINAHKRLELHDPDNLNLLLH